MFFHLTKWLTDVGWVCTFNLMVKSESQRLDRLFHALGDATRREMLRALSEGERTVTELAEPFSISLAAVSKHVKALEAAGLVTREVRWREHRCRLNAAAMSEAHSWLSYYERFWTQRLDTLEALLREEDASGSEGREDA